MRSWRAVGKCEQLLCHGKLQIFLQWSLSDSWIYGCNFIDAAGWPYYLYAECLCSLLEVMRWSKNGCGKITNGLCHTRILAGVTPRPQTEIFKYTQIECIAIYSAEIEYIILKCTNLIMAIKGLKTWRVMTYHGLFKFYKVQRNATFQQKFFLKLTYFC